MLRDRNKNELIILGFFHFISCLGCQIPSLMNLTACAAIDKEQENPSEINDFRGILVRVVRLERTVSWSQTRRDTNFAIPGYSISAIIPRRGRKSKIFLSVVIYVVKAASMPFSAIGGNSANAGVARLCGVLPCPTPDTATALPKQARYQLRYTRICGKCYYTAHSARAQALICQLP